ncbi:hypothetical protein Zm00014a_005047 [Zea mays]|uniref:Uncharacterized protein n=6 Tax=Zea mays TaxID=4577 RepID=A0A1D6GSB2_MAIZE|nr:uncharacterized protein LOC103626274 isoform X1 [Zea mays]AQK65944.1 hypothetical protein ZEAMMB73_Zm00001d014340 [Zea mays]AQK65948.1 hypothetical protein ZEAMMB73_Zm00001d014340 [Zea mays]PWZ21408.1 hypothetical protein Zm00014a_005047 [Zea mays]PWZ21409.1 hypothetical protein Zm00014a_005047 [Zea mays]|eukprot:XP_008644886.1 uncharacterized protein LOC103626274 isoform X1 [Zea mays]
MVAEAAPFSSSAIWSCHRDEITFDRLHKFWSALSPHARHELLRLDKQTLIEHARKNLYCSRCNGLLLESFTQIVMYGKSLLHEGSCEPRIQEVEAEVQEPSVHPWGGLSTTKDGILTLLDCFINAKSLHVIQNVFDNARAREREREMLYPDACGGGGRGWISPVIPNYGRGHGTRDTCALHTAHLSCDTLVDFWSALGEETRSSLLRMKEEDFIERLMHRFDSKRFCRDCRRNVIREFKELKELKRMRREPRCTSWFCVADTTFKCEVFEDAILVDWHQSLLEQDGIYHHFEWAIGTDEGKSDILNFENVGMNGQVHRKGLDLDHFEDYFVTLRAWRLDGRCTEFCVKAHALKGQSCVHRRLIVGDGFVTITKGESIRSFFEYAEEAEEEDEDDVVDRDSNDPDGDIAHPQKHAKSPELAREFLLDAAAVIFKEQIEKAFREGTARQNAHSVFVSLALKLLEERVHVACKEIITLEKQTKLLEEEEKEKREEEERRERRRTKEREKKNRRKERLKGKDRDKEKTLVRSKKPDLSPFSLCSQATPSNNESQDVLDLRYSDSEEEDNVVVGEHYPDSSADQSSSKDSDERSNGHECSVTIEFVPSDCDSSFLCDEPKSSRNLRFRRDFPEEKDASYWHEGCCDDSGDTQWQSRERTRNNTRNYNSVFNTNNRTRDRYNPCSCSHQEDYRYFTTATRSSRETKMPRKTVAEKPRLQYRRCYPPDSFAVSNGGRVGGTPNKNPGPKQVWEPMDARKKTGNGNSATGAADGSDQVECSNNISECEKLEAVCDSLVEICSEISAETCKSDTDQPWRQGEKNQSACSDESKCVDKPNCSKDTGRTTNLTTSDSSSCLSEGDRDSSMTSLSVQNVESSSASDSEESSDRNNSSPGDIPAKNVSRTLLEMCAGNGFREYQPKGLNPPNGNQFGFMVAPSQEQMLYQQKVHAPPYSSPFMGFHNHPLAVPTNGYLPYTQPGHFYPASMTPVGYGVAGDQCVDFSMQYRNNIHPYSGPEFGFLPSQPVHKTSVNFHAVPVTPLTPLCSRGMPVATNQERQQSPALFPKLKQAVLVPETVCAGDNTFKQKGDDVDSTPFSLFQFNLPIAPPTLATSKERSGELAPAQIARVQPCSREETNVKEYNIFSGCDGVMFQLN